MKLTITRGLPASGKSTWALEQVKASNGKIKRVNRDSLRAMIDGGQWSKDRERVIKHIEMTIAHELLDDGYSVIVDDTCLDQHTVHDWHVLAQDTDNDFEIQDFTDVPLEECIKRDQKRPNYVGEKVIRRLWRQHLQPKIEPPVYIEGAPDAIICDLDGTLAILGGRNPYDASTCEQDETNGIVYHLLRLYHKERGAKLIFVSGRMDTWREQTKHWLDEEGPSSQYLLFMRRQGDTRQDAIIKREIYEREIVGNYNILFVLDDRNQCINLWRSLGLTALQVADGDF